MARRTGLEVREVRPVSTLFVTAVVRGTELTPGAMKFTELLTSHAREQNRS